MHVNRQNTDASKAIILGVLTKEIFKECKISQIIVKRTTEESFIFSEEQMKDKYFKIICPQNFHILWFSGY